MRKFIKELFLGLILAVLLVGIFIQAVVQQSFRNYPPTAAELAKNPSLERYVK